MALRIWLPLNGNIENRGLSGPASSEGTIVYGDGKVGGKALYMESAVTTNGIYAPKQEKQVFTVSIWFKAPGYTGTRRDLCNEGRDYTTYGWRISLNSNTNQIVMRISTLDIYTHNFTPNTWYHVAISKDENAVARFYVNGELVSTQSNCPDLNYSESNGYVNVGRMGYSTSNNKIYAYTGYLNDFRYYDEALSQKQIREISKGLIVHYKLAPPNINSNLAVDNPLINSGATSVGYNKDTHTYTIVSPVGDSTWGYGLNIGSTNKCIVPWNSTYRFSFEVWVPTQHEIRVDFNNYANEGSSWSGNDNDLTSARYNDTVITVPAQTWTKLVFGSKNANTNNTNQVAIYDVSKIGLRTMNDTEPVTWYLRNFKYELGDTATEYVPYGYNQMESLNTDCSGNLYNSSTLGTLYCNTDSARYLTSTNFINNTSYIKLPILNTANLTNSFTIACWSKNSSIGGKMMWGFGDGNRLNIYPTNGILCCNTGNSANNPYKNNGASIEYSPLVGNWHHYVMTGDGVSNKLYIDGELAGIAKTYAGPTGTQLYISGWDTGAQYKWIDGSISDFRIYSTPLSAEDVKELYQTSAIIDNLGNAYSREFREE